MATFEPIIGNGFDAIAAQRFGYNQANLATEIGNVNRFTQAQEQADAKARYIAGLNQRAADQQAAADSSAEADAESARRFGIQTDLTREANQTRYGQEAERTAYYNRALGQQQANVAADAATVDSAAQTLAPRIHEYGTALSTAQAAKDAALAALQSKPAELQASMPEGVFYNGKAFTATNPKSAKSASEANLALVTAQNDYQAAQRQFALHQKNFNDEVAHARKSYGLEISHDGDQWVVKNPQTQRTYRPDGKAKPGPKSLADQPVVSGSASDARARFNVPGIADPLDALYGPAPTQPDFTPQTANRFMQPTMMSVAAPVAPQASPDQSGTLFNPPNLRFGIPNAPMQPAITRVRVKSPDGKTGSIPANQLDAAIANGYVQVQ